jgi:hypothetical protein
MLFFILCNKHHRIRSPQQMRSQYQKEAFCDLVHYCSSFHSQAYRVQNPRQLRQFNDKGAELRGQYAPYGSQVHFETRLLFHGTAPAAISGIVLDNFDWRRAGEAVGASFGCGVYFGTSFMISDGYARDACHQADATTRPAAVTPAGTVDASERRRFMFVAAVHVGLCCRGQANLR